MQILNIDAYVTPKRQVNYKGVAHPVLEVSVQEFIDNLAAAERLEADSAAGKVDLKQSMNDSVAAVCRSIPSLPEDEVRKMPIPALTALLQFIRGQLDPEVAKAVADASAGAPAAVEGDAAKKA